MTASELWTQAALAAMRAGVNAKYAAQEADQIVAEYRHRWFGVQLPDTSKGDPK